MVLHLLVRELALGLKFFEFRVDALLFDVALCGTSFALFLECGQTVLVGGILGGLATALLDVKLIHRLVVGV